MRNIRNKIVILLASDKLEEPTPSGLFTRIQRNPDTKDAPALIASLKNYPPRIKVAKRHNENELLVFIKKGRLYIHGIKYKNGEESDVYQAAFEDVFDKIVCTKEEKALPLSGSFWETYENVKKFKELRAISPSEQSLEQKALNNLATFINKIQSEEIIPYKDFLRTLREDILDYGTLSDYTLRRIANLEYGDEAKQRQAVSEIIALKNELGEDYLQKEKARLKDLSKEIIIAIENQLK